MAKPFYFNSPKPQKKRSFELDLPMPEMDFTDLQDTPRTLKPNELLKVKQDGKGIDTIAIKDLFDEKTLRLEIAQAFGTTSSKISDFVGKIQLEIDKIKSERLKHGNDGKDWEPTVSELEDIAKRASNFVEDGKPGDDGDKGDKGDIPKHEWDGTKLRFEQADGKWGKWVDLIGKEGIGSLFRGSSAKRLIDLADVDVSGLTYVNGKYILGSGSGSGSSTISVDGTLVTDPDFVSTGNVDFTNTTGAISADVDLTGKADLVSGKVPAGQLPSYVDDVLEYANLAAFPVTGETGKIYVALDSNKVYRWSGSAYVAISDFDISSVTTDNLIQGTTNLYSQWGTTWADIHRLTGNVGLGTTTPTFKLDVAGKIGINGTQGLYIPGGDFTGSMFVGDGGQNLAYTSGVDGRFNTGLGLGALSANTTGGFNTATGYQSLSSNTTGSNNVASGRESLYSNTTGTNNVASGALSLLSNTTGSNNVASGYASLALNTTGSNNVASGFRSLYDLTTGLQNTAIGFNSGRGITTGNYNTILGANVTGLAAGLANNIIIADGQGNQRINVTSGGNVGIGTAAPGSNLQIGDGSAVDRSIAIRGNIANTSSFLWQANDGSNRFSQYANLDGTLDNDLLTFRSFSTDNILSLTGNGNVGIGTSTPGAKLDVNGNVYVRGALGLYTDSIRAYSGTNIAFNNTGNTTFIGNVGIGTTSPLGKLHANGGDAYFGDEENNARRMYFRRNAATVGGITTDSGLFSLFGGASPATHLTVRSSGNVGIGVTNPIVKLDVAGNIRIDAGTADFNYALDVTKATQRVAKFESTGTNAAADVLIIDADNSNSRAALQIQGNGGANEVLFATSGGNVGIGTTTPAYKLDVAGTIRAFSASDASIYSSRTGGSTIRIEGGSSSGYIKTTTNHPLSFGTNNANDLLYIATTGNVGIGITPDTRLDVNGAITQRELSADPTDPAEGSSVTWQSDGTGGGDDGDIMMKITAGGVTKTITLIDFSAA